MRRRRTANHGRSEGRPGAGDAQTRGGTALGARPQPAPAAPHRAALRLVQFIRASPSLALAGRRPCPAALPRAARRRAAPIPAHRPAARTAAAPRPAQREEAAPRHARAAAVAASMQRWRKGGRPGPTPTRFNRQSYRTGSVALRSAENLAPFQAPPENTVHDAAQAHSGR